MSDKIFDVVVIGGGIAGTAIAAHLAQAIDVAVLEMEGQPGYHSTGRSAALFALAYGNHVIRALTRASRDFFFNPEPSFCEEPLISPRKVLIFGREEQRVAFEELIARELPADHLDLIDAAAALELCPVLKADGLLGGLLDSGSADIEVHALQHAYIRKLKRAGGKLFVSAGVQSIAFDADSRLWTATTPAGVFVTRTLVNAAGAWADRIAVMAGARPVGLEPRRRTAALIDAPEGSASHAWPMVLDAEERFYMKPDAGLLLISPADETMSEPEDAQPDEIDIAIAADRLETLTSIQVRRIKSKWAGLRSFVADRSPVVGFDPLRPGFFWLAALGGYGIQTAPALSELAAKLAQGQSADADFARLNFRATDISPTRFALESDPLRGESGAGATRTATPVLNYNP